jgi:hypothetical protein
MSFLLLKYPMRELVTKAEMLNHIIRNHQDYFPVIFSRASECMQLDFGTDLKEVGPSNHSCVLVIALGHMYYKMLSDIQGMSKMGLFIILLCVILLEGNYASEEVVWKILSVMEVCAGRGHDIYGTPRRLITEDFVQEKYFVYQKVPNNHLVCYEFLCCPRAHAKTDKMNALEH